MNRSVWFASLMGLAMAFLLPLMIVGCGGDGKAETQSADEKTADENKDDGKKKDEPKIAGFEGFEAASSEQLIDPNAAIERPRRETYHHVELHASGTLAGICVMPAKDGGELAKKYGGTLLPEGENAIKDPKKGEVEYYKKIKMKVPAYLRYDKYKKRYTVVGTVLLFRDVKVGARPPLIRAGFTIKRGFMDQWGCNGRHYGVCISPVNDRLQFETFDRHSYDVVMKDPSGKVIFETEVPAWTTDLTDQNWTVPAPKAVISKVILKEMGLYTLTEKRKPWMKGFVHVVDNPYAIVVKPERRTFGTFNVPKVPAGKHRVDVWHPVFEPEEKTIEIDIKKNGRAEIEIKLKAP